MHLKSNWREHVDDPRRNHALAVRSKLESGIRDFFASRDYTEVRTPLLVPCPGMEAHIRPYHVTPFGRVEQEVRSGFLATSPEFAMKRLLVGGMKRIYQISPAFRAEPTASTHLPEFTMLEWYQAGMSYEQLMEEVEGLFHFLAHRIHQSEIIPFQKQEIYFELPFTRLSVKELFQHHLDFELREKTSLAELAKLCDANGIEHTPALSWDDLFQKLWGNLIEPRLPADQPVMVTHYHARHAAWAKLAKDRSGDSWAQRFEIYAGGMELGNAFEELADPVEQEQRFEKAMAERERCFGEDFPHTPPDHGFLDALRQGLPPCSGIALGVDRLVMLFADEPEIEKTVWI